MLIKKKYTHQSLGELEGEWKEIAIIFQRLCTTERHRLADGTIMEQIKTSSLPFDTFLNCVSHIVDIVSNEFGAMEVRGLYDALDYTLPHTNRQPLTQEQEYEYCCNRLYERTVIFGAVYYVIAVQNPELTDVLTTIYNYAYYKESRPYLEHFTFALRQKMNASNTADEDKLIPPHIIPNIQHLNDGYRNLKPHDRLRKFKQLSAYIDSLTPEEKTPKVETLRLVLEYTIHILQRTYNLWDSEFVPDSEKVLVQDLISEYSKIASTDGNGSIAEFIKNVLSAKKPSAQDAIYLDLLETHRAPIIAKNVIIQENIGSITSIEQSDVTYHSQQ